MTATSFDKGVLAERDADCAGQQNRLWRPSFGYAAAQAVDPNVVVRAAVPVSAPQATVAPVSSSLKEGNYIVRQFHFRSGESMAEVRLHYGTLGEPHRDAKGQIDNAVVLLHGTGGNGRQFLAPEFAGELFGPGQPLDIRKYWIVMPDDFGSGQSSKPSDGLRMNFPHYDYADMVQLQHKLLVDGLHVSHARLILGTSMGCMHTFVWGATYPNYARALMPLACEPIPVAGLNHMWRQMIIDGIEADPSWDGGNYQAQPQEGLRLAESLMLTAVSAPLNWQKLYPTGAASTAFERTQVKAGMATLDANDFIYQLDSSRTYDPWPTLEKITAPMMWVNSADDFVNPRNFVYPKEAIARLPNARFRLIPETADTHGHPTFNWAVNWKADLIDLLDRTAN